MIIKWNESCFEKKSIFKPDDSTFYNIVSRFCLKHAMAQ